jgi:large subunit ribosomal protein L3
MTKRLMGKKRGMVQMFDEKGNTVACSVIHAEPSVITQIKNRVTDGYEAIQLGFDEIRVKDERTVQNRLSKPLLGAFRKKALAPCRHLYEVRLDNSAGFEVGQKLSVAQFQGVPFVDVIGVSKGKGYQGVMKKYHFAGGPASHGSGFHRHAGSTGMRSTPGRCLPGGKRPSHMGDVRVTVQNLRVVAIDETQNVIIVEGAIPGAKNACVVLQEAVKKKAKSQAKKTGKQ